MTDIQKNVDSPRSLRNSGFFYIWYNKILSMTKSVRSIFSIVLLIFLAMLDFATGYEISFSVFYLAPVTFAGFFLSSNAGRVMALLCAAVWGYLDFATGNTYTAIWIPFWNSGVRLGFFLIVNELINILRSDHAQLLRLSRTDQLTGLANANVYREKTFLVIEQSRRNQQPFTITYIDLDRFKQVNDQFGHSEGDRLLRTIAAIIENHTRTIDVVARLGGDEFAILMPGTGMQQALVALQRIADAIKDSVERQWAVGATFGAVTFSEPPVSVDFAVHKADVLMYRGKAEGRGCILQAMWPESAAIHD